MGQQVVLLFVYQETQEEVVATAEAFVDIILNLATVVVDHCL